MHSLVGVWTLSSMQCNYPIAKFISTLWPCVYITVLSWEKSWCEDEGARTWGRADMLKAPKINAKSKMSKVSIVVIITSIMKQERKWYSFISFCCSNLSWNLDFVPLIGREGSPEEAEKASISAGKTKIKRNEEF